MAAKQITQVERDLIEAVYTSRRIAELHLDPVRGAFDAAHLREINRRIFQDLPKQGLSDVTPGQYRPAVPAGMDWGKHRQLESVGVISHVAYSAMDATARERLDRALGSIDIARWSKLKAEAFTTALARLYTELDYIHPFPDGNSRTLRVFTGQIADACGYHID